MTIVLYFFLGRQGKALLLMRSSNSKTSHKIVHIVSGLNFKLYESV
jgi:hypothetical protein